jgi:hypothetical protein
LLQQKIYGRNIRNELGGSQAKRKKGFNKEEIMKNNNEIYILNILKRIFNWKY